MTEKNRIILNTVATYGRSMFGVLCGIFSTRWVLAALGQEDFGLYAVIGSMVIFLSFLNIQLAGAISRYYAFSIGRAKSMGDSRTGLEECRAWFTTAVLIHLTVPLFLLVTGWPLGVYGIRHGWIDVPLARLESCLWVWHFVCICSFFGMIAVPFQAMYTAKQYIAELTIYSFIQTVARTVFVYYMFENPREWLVIYAFAMGVISVLPQIVICMRACVVFEECRIVKKAFRELWRVRDVTAYAVWTAFGGLGYVASHQCMSILLNNFYGAKIVSGFGIAQTVSSEAASLTGALQGAFQPAITTSYGTGEIERMKTMAFRVCKVGTMLTLMFAIPMALEIDEILHLWLKEPPVHAAQMCLCVLMFIVLEKFTAGHITAVNATGRIAMFQIVRGCLRATVILLAAIVAFCGWGAVAATATLPASVVLVDLGDVYMARKKIGMSAWYWLRRVVLPLCALVIVVIPVGLLPRLVLPPSLMRVVVTTIVVLSVLIPFSWRLVLDANERSVLYGEIAKRFGMHYSGRHTR